MSDTTVLNITAYQGRLPAPKRLLASVPAAVPFAVRIGSWLREAIRRRQSRHAIAGLDSRMLRDIGVSWAEAEAEANKPWWRS